MNKYNAKVTCSIGIDDNKKATARVAVSVKFDTELMLDLEELSNNPLLLQKAVVACQKSITDEYFTLKRLDLLDKLSEEDKQTFIEANAIEFTAHLVHI